MDYELILAENVAQLAQGFFFYLDTRSQMEVFNKAAAVSPLLSQSKDNILIGNVAKQLI